MRTRVKICGITRVEDGLAAARCGADAIGLVFYPKSARAVSVAAAREIAGRLPPFVSVVALFVNAAEAMSGPGQEDGELSVRLKGDADEVRIDIGDTGVGIPAEVIPQIFEPFFSTKENENGVGLGLAVVYGIVHRHSGTIDVSSEPGHGTVFHLRLPRRRPTATEEA